MAKYETAFYECDNGGCDISVLWKKDESPEGWIEKIEYSDYSGISHFHFCKQCSESEMNEKDHYSLRNHKTKNKKA